MPSLQEQAIKMTKEAVHALFRTARHIPEDKRNDWSPMGEARTVLDQLVECAGVPFFFASLLNGQPMDLSDPAVQAKRKELEASMTSLEAAEAVAEKSHEALYAAIAAVPDSALEEVRPVPWNPNAQVVDIIFFAYWNLVYHTGQINYMQLLLGDKEMH